MAGVSVPGATGAGAGGEPGRGAVTGDAVEQAAAATRINVHALRDGRRAIMGIVPRSASDRQLLLLVPLEQPLVARDGGPSRL